ncbi:MAG TPA: ATP-binding protein, partial [Ohtaekwangia sp.]|uniref:ATP-binding protein n=1 Tax=Ohtaekwangia sp. TaxID=2066019 RepID=UPI002F925A60
DRDDKTVKYILSHERDNGFSLSEDKAQLLYQTRDHVIWIGTFGYGLNKYNPDVSAFSYLGEQSPLPLSTNYISTIFTHDDSTLFIGTSRGLNLVDMRRGVVNTFFSDKEMNLVYKIKADARGDIWVSTAAGFYNYRDSRFIPIAFNPGPMYDIADWDEQTIALATRMQGIYLFSKATHVSELLIPASQLPDVVFAIQVTKNNLWVAGKDGLRVFTRDGRLQKHFRSRSGEVHGLPVDNVKCIFSDHLHNLWVGTWGGGLCKFNEGDSTFTTYDLGDGLPNNVIYGIIEDNMGILWLSTNMGISAFDPRKKTFRNFDYLDGLQGNEFNTGAYFRSIYGKIYFGGIDGLTFFDPEKVLIPSNAPTVMINELAINDHPPQEHNYTQQESIHVTDELISTWRLNDITLEFTSVDFKQPRKLNFQYSVDNGEWHDIGNRRNLEFINLPMGRHQVKMRARKPGSSWGIACSLTINISPPFWRKTPVIALFFIIALAGIYATYRIRLKYLTHVNLTLNKLVKERTQEVEIKNDQISAQNGELTRQTELLVDKNLQLEQQQLQLMELSNELERKVDDRTKDIQLLNQDLLEQNVQLEQFSFITAHNFRGPVARIKGLTELLSQRELSKEDLNSFLVHMKSSVNDLDEVTKDLNKILSIKKTSPDFFEEVELKPVLDKALMLLEEEIRTSGIFVDVTKFEFHTIRGSKSYTQSIFYNLIQNAIRYSRPKAGPFIKITCTIVGSQVRIQFIDNGIGIDLKLAMNKIFRLYQRFTYNSNGRGLGLFLVKTQVDIMGGEISVESSLGEGSVFTITFPQ